MTESRSHHFTRAAFFAAFVALLGAALTWLLVWTELQYGETEVDWTVFAVITTLMLICERVPATWIRFGPVATVTPLWMFAFGLMLLGSPTAAVAVATVGATIHAIGNCRARRSSSPGSGRRRSRCPPPAWC